jgi:endonuclease/exonuclease/phosphatase family metal-dependent hydrolase
VQPAKTLILCLLFLCALSLPVFSQEQIRVASYNIKFLKTSVSTEDDRLTKLREVIAHLDAKVIGLQEIDNRAALELLFRPQDWHIIIDDNSNDDQDVALVVKKPLRILAVNPDLDADDPNFLFPNTIDDSSFPNRRDVLAVEVQLPDQSESFFVMVVHAKSRFGGRLNTEQRRVGAARLLAGVLRQRFSDKDFILLGDFNDNPDDQSLNILETGDANAPAGPEELDGPFLINLMEPLLAAGHVSHGRSSDDIVGSKINTLDLGSRQRNNANRGNNNNTGDILFDQILIPLWMQTRYIQGSAKVFDHEIAVRGNNSNIASDHLPVSAEFVFGVDEPDGGNSGGLRIVAVLPNPLGDDAGREEVTLANTSSAAISLQGWKLRDRSGNDFTLSGSVPAGGQLRVVLSTNSMPLNNSGDDVLLLDAQGTLKHQVTYSAVAAQAGARITFP